MFQIAPKQTKSVKATKAAAPKKNAKGRKAVAPAPLVVKKAPEAKKKLQNPLFEKRPRCFGIGKF